MKLKVHPRYGVTANTYVCEVGEGLPWHDHPGQPHSHSVLAGRTRVEVKGQLPIEVTPDTPDMELPPTIPHQITAIEPGTVFLNIIAGETPIHLPVPVPVVDERAGVRLHDGTVVDAP